MKIDHKKLRKGKIIARLTMQEAHNICNNQTIYETRKIYNIPENRNVIISLGFQPKIYLGGVIRRSGTKEVEE